MRVRLLIMLLLLSFAGMAQNNPCKPKGDPEGKPGCPDGKCPDPPAKDPKKIPVVAPMDPNEIIGFAGFDSARWVSVRQNIPYKILFENDPDFATAAAQKVTIYLPVHGKLNPASVRIGDFGFGPFNFTVPENTSVYYKRLDVRDSLGMFVDVTAGLDMVNRRIFWTFQSIDPATGLAATLPPQNGFLAVNDTVSHKGEGYVTFNIMPSSAAASGDTVLAIASILFDSEASIETNTWTNVVDAVAPTSSVSTMPPFTDSVFTVKWSGADDQKGSGLAYYALYYSRNNGPYALFSDKIDSTSIEFKGSNGDNYSFYTLATDNTGNRETEKQVPDQTVTVSGGSLRVSLRAWLQGAYRQQENLMTDSLRAQRVIPLTQPYRALGFQAVNQLQEENISAGLLDTVGAKAVTDWVWLELRDAADPITVMATRAALIRRDGLVTDLDGKSSVAFPNMKAGNYHIVLRHRNHLGIMTGSAVTLSATTQLIDFTAAATATYGSDARRAIGTQMALWAGDVNQDGSIRYNGAANDKTSILEKVGVASPNSSLRGYDVNDINLDGKVRYNGAGNDKTIILNNVGVATPNNSITQQLPRR